MTHFRKGSYLEGSIETLFKRAGFRTQLDSRVKGYEIDVLASKGSFKVIVECKQYEQSHLPVKNILHQWASKNDIIGANKVIVAVAGQSLSEDEYRLAKQLDMVLIGEDKIHALNLLNADKLREELNKIIKFDVTEYREKERKNLIKVIPLNAIIFHGLLFVLFYFVFVVGQLELSSYNLPFAFYLFQIAYSFVLYLIFVYWWAEWIRKAIRKKLNLGEDFLYRAGKKK